MSILVCQQKWPPKPLIGWQISTCKWTNYLLGSQYTTLELSPLDRMDNTISLWRTRDIICIISGSRGNSCMNFNQTCSEAIARCPLPSLLLCRPINKDGRPGLLWLADGFLTSLLQPLYRFQPNNRNLVRSLPSLFCAHLSTKMAALASDWLTHFLLPFFNHCMDLKYCWYSTSPIKVVHF